MKLKTDINFKLLALLLFSINIYAELNHEEKSDDYHNIKKINSFLKESIGSEFAYSVKKTDIAGIYSVSFGMQVIYLTGDLKFVFKGDFYSTSNGENITLSIKQNLRATALSSIDKKTTISFLAKNTVPDNKNVYVFTDVDCGYCRKFHKEVSDLNGMGINVHYLAFPRAGQRGKTYEKMVSVWCASDRNNALRKVKEGKNIPNKKCKNPINEHYKLGLDMELTGTPTVYNEDGILLGGFVTAKDIKQTLFASKGNGD